MIKSRQGAIAKFRFSWFYFTSERGQMKMTVLLCCFFAVCMFAQYEDTGKRGLYFPKKNYTGVELPIFNAVKDQLPSPVLDDNPEWVKLYWKAWELAFKHYKKPPQGSPFVSDYIDEAFSPSIFQWDTIFMILFARYAHHLFPCVVSLDNFYCRQYENGYICREIDEATGTDYVCESRDNTINPPLFSWAELEYARVSGDSSRYQDVLPALVKYAGWLEKYRKKANTKHDLFWQTGLGSGMDNTPRSGSAWIDMSSQMAMFYRDISLIAGHCGDKTNEQLYQAKYKETAERINSLMWNNEDGFYYDLDDNAKQIKVKTIASFWPLLAGIASKDQAARLMLHLKNTNEFWRETPFPSLSADHPAYKPDGEYWLGGVWAPTNIMVIKGLERYSDLNNTAEFCNAASEKYIDAMSKVFKRTGTIWENYSPDATRRGIQSQPDFVGWSGCGPITLLLENVIGIIPDAVNHSVHWTITRKDRYGIQNLTFGTTNATLICSERESVAKPCSLEIKSNKAFTLVVSREFNKEHRFDIKPGTNTITVP